MTTAKRPAIGINTDLDTAPREHSRTYAAYFDAVHAAGGLPVIIPPIVDESYVDEQLARIDGLVLVGGDDIHPAAYAQETHPSCKLLRPRRNEFDLLLARRALEQGPRLPILGICCGCQLLNVSLGGDLIQDIPDLVAGAIAHQVPPGSDALSVAHPVRVEPGSRLASIVGTAVEANSSHHQSIGRLGSGLRTVAWAPDGVIEAVEGEEAADRFLLGVQWHPERLPTERPHRALFEALVSAAVSLSAHVR